ncbi:IS110 family transposase [Marinoscillum sp.]|uniref:IS110 family transposase n=1 Tax=Marinoscillum sp. TaxID=2024838 RepID=UPI003BA8BFA9
MKTVILGIDVSKNTLDIVLMITGSIVYQEQIENSSKTFLRWLKRLIKERNINLSECMVCMEHTGVYCHPVIISCQQLGCFLWVEDAGRIKAFHSLSRGKNDALDAERIATYAYLKQSEAKNWEAPRSIIRELKGLMKLRKRLLDTKQRLSVPLKEELEMIKDDWSRGHQQHIRPILKQITNELKKVEIRIKELVATDQALKQTYQQVTSVKGVGMVVGLSMILLTNEFKTISDPRKMACHCGVAPFPYQSGKSIKGRTKVSHRAHKPIKALLNMAARSSVSSPGELRDYYDRKVKAGKNKMLVLNAIRNKLIHRVFACVRDGRIYDEIYTHPLV